MYPPSDPEAELRSLESRIATNAALPELWLELGDVHQRRKATNEAWIAYGKAQALLRPRLSKEPSNGWLRAQLAGSLVLTNTSAWEESDRLHREAVQLAPTESRTWVALANFELLSAVHDLGMGEHLPPVEVGDLGDLFERVRAWMKRRDVTGAGRSAALARLSKSREALDRAVRVPDPTLEALMARWVFDSSVAPMLKSMFAESPSSDDERMAALMDPGLVGHLRQVARLSTNEPYALGLGVTLVVTSMLARERDPDIAVMKTDLRPRLTRDDRAFVEDMMRRLELLRTHPTPRVAGGALLALGFLASFVDGNPTNAAALALRADRMDPANPAALPLALVTLSSAGQHEEAARLADLLVARRDVPESRAIRAKVLARVRRYDDAEADLNRILQIQSTNAMAQVGRVALAVLRGDAKAMEEGFAMMSRLGSEGALEGDRNLRRESKFIAAAVMALGGKVPQARRILYSVLAEAPSDARAREALEALAK
jgi:tetratricopeptide (TPR) repeat protein